MAGPNSTVTEEEVRAASSAARERLVPHLYVVLHAEQPLIPGSRHSLAETDQVLLGRGDSAAFARTGRGDETRRLSLTLPDRWMSVTHARVHKVLGRWLVEDAGSRNGTLVNGRALSEAWELRDGDVLEVGHTVLLFRLCRAPGEGVPKDERAAAAEDPPGLQTLQPELAHELGVLRRLAPSPVSVVLRGESGTGKEMVASAVHRLSKRPGEFVAVNCGALPSTLLESELFGYKRGAFTGAAEDRPGLVRSAEGGTLFLDEIGDLPLPGQAALLRVLQEAEVTPVGATRPLKVDVRIVCATHRDLDSLTERGEFRPDLLARLSGYLLTLPPLRQRKEDLGLLFAALLRRHAGRDAERVTLAPEVARGLLRHAWPLNVRELDKNVLMALALMDSSRRLGREQFPQLGRPLTPPHGSPPLVHAESPTDEARRTELLSLLDEHQGNVSSVARAMNKARMQIHRWMKRYRIDPRSFRR